MLQNRDTAFDLRLGCHDVSNTSRHDAQLREHVSLISRITIKHLALCPVVGMVSTGCEDSFRFQLARVRPSEGCLRHRE